MTPFRPFSPENEEVYLLVDGQAFSEWTSYSFNSHFLTPTDGFSFTAGTTETLRDEMKSVLTPGRRVQLKIGKQLLATGAIDSVSISFSRSSGTIFSVSGRDTLAQVIDGNADPTMQFKDGQNLEQFIRSIFEPFGFKSVLFTEETTEIEQVITKRPISASDPTKTDEFLKWVPRKKGSDPFAPKKTVKRVPLREIIIPQIRPYHQEGLFAFAARVCQRYGLWIWPGSDGISLIVSKPDFDQAPRYSLTTRSEGGRWVTNILDGSVTRDITDQPGIIVAEGHVGKPAFGKTRVRAVAVNPAIKIHPDHPIFQKYELTSKEEVELSLARSTKTDEFLTWVPRKKAMPSKVTVTHRTPLRVVPMDDVGEPMDVPATKVLFLYDHDSATQEQLEAFTRREMSLRLQKSLVARYTVEGHGQIVRGENGEDVLVPWEIDRIVDVDDAITGIQQQMYILSRTFRKSRSGTTTELELIRPHTLQFEKVDRKRKRSKRLINPDT